MNKRLLACIIVLGLCSGATASAQEQKSGLMGWLKSIQKKIDQVKPKKTLSTSNAVAGIRGAKQDSQVKLYWKGKKGDEIVTEEELGKFKAGVDLADKGDRSGAVKALEDFMKQYPDSALIPDVKKTLDLAKAEPLEVKKEEKQEAVKEEKKEEKKEEPKPEEKQEVKKDEKKEAVKDEKKE